MQSVVVVILWKAPFVNRCAAVAASCECVRPQHTAGCLISLSGCPASPRTGRAKIKGTPPGRRVTGVGLIPASVPLHHRLARLTSIEQRCRSDAAKLSPGVSARFLPRYSRSRCHGSTVLGTGYKAVSRASVGVPLPAHRLVQTGTPDSANVR